MSSDAIGWVLVILFLVTCPLLMWRMMRRHPHPE